MVNNSCHFCQKPFLRNRTRKFCGRPCYERWYSITKKGRGPHNKGGRIIKHGSGHAHIWMPEHPRASKQGYVREHILVAEKALGKSLPLSAVVHHVRPNEPANNAPSNLLICENQAYHALLHKRMQLRAEGKL